MQWRDQASWSKVKKENRNQCEYQQQLQMCPRFPVHITLHSTTISRRCRYTLLHMWELIWETTESAAQTSQSSTPMECLECCLAPLCVSLSILLSFQFFWTRFGFLHSSHVRSLVLCVVYLISDQQNMFFYFLSFRSLFQQGMSCNGFYFSA